jgi:HK97 family phage major capsid protein
MSATTTQTELRLQSLLDERETTQKLHEELISRIQEMDDKLPDSTQKEQLKMYRERNDALDAEITELSEVMESDRRAIAASAAIRRALAGSMEGVDVDDDGIVYRSMAAYARDVILTRESQVCSKIASQFGDKSAIQSARERLQLIKRTPADTLSSNVGGLQPPQHIAQILQVIDDSRPLVDSARRTTLERGTLTYPLVSQRPVVAVQMTEKTEAGNQGMVVDMETTTASTYLGGGDLSWQALNWSTPDALQLWFDLAAADYALKTEADASQAMQHSAFTYNISTLLGSTFTFAEFLTAVAAGASDVFANSGRKADTLYTSVDRYWYVFGLTSAAFAQFATVSDAGIGPLKIVASRGMDSGVMAVGDSSALLVAETAGAPVELRVVEPAIGGVEVGIIGAFEAVVVDPGAFAMITTAS